MDEMNKTDSTNIENKNVAKINYEKDDSGIFEKSSSNEEGSVNAHDVLSAKSTDNVREPLILKAADKFLLAGALGLGILFVWLFYGIIPGISIPIYVVAFYSFLLAYERPVLKKEAVFGWFLSIPIFMISVTFFIFDNEILLILNLLALPWLIMLQTLLITGANSFMWHSPGILVDLLFGLFYRCLIHIFRPFRFLPILFHRNSETKGKSVSSRVLAGLVISLPLLLILLLLLSSADMVFGKLVERLPEFFIKINLDDFIGKAVVAIIISLIAFSYMWSIRLGEKPAENSLSGVASKTPEQKKRLDLVIITTVTASVDALYVLFVGIQFAYLFGGSGLPEGFTYAEYARSGFFELILVSLLNIGFLAFTLTYTKKGNRKADVSFKILNTVMISCTFIMLFSAHYRMSLYENAYGFTFLRIMTHAFMGFLLLLFLITLARVWKESLPLLKPYIAVAIVAYTVINFMNVDVIISKNNIARYTQTKVIDMDYYKSLSNDVVVDLIKLAEDKDAAVSSAANKMLGVRKVKLSQNRHWQSFNISDYKALKMLEKGW